jgi:hypothetical protein
MSDIKNDNGAEPDATATTTPNAQSTNTNGADPVAENTESAKVETAEQTNNGARSTESPSKSRGDSHHHHQNNRRRSNMSKYDPSVRGVSSDAAEIRKLVRQHRQHSIRDLVLTFGHRLNFTSVTPIFQRTTTCGSSLTDQPIFLCRSLRFTPLGV